MARRLAIRRRFEKKLAELYPIIHNADTRTLRRFRKDLDGLSTTNCWFGIWDMREWLTQQIDSSLSWRKHNKAKRGGA